MVEEPIKTIYEPGNKSSHFNPIVDSMKVYFVLLRFGSVLDDDCGARQPSSSSRSPWIGGLGAGQRRFAASSP